MGGLHIAEALQIPYCASEPLDSCKEGRALTPHRSCIHDAMDQVSYLPRSI